MYSTCLFCNRPLGRNEAIEHFPVGRRLAFDAAKGRLWVVCRLCERWNLTPLDERWEAIEEAERSYRDTKKRSSTDNIGLARLVEGTELVRIGSPLRPEFAAWRYGDQFGRRYRRHMTYSVAGMVIVSAVTIAPIFGVGTALLGSAVSLSHSAWQHIGERVKRMSITDERGAGLRLTRQDCQHAKFIGNPVYGNWQLDVRHRVGLKSGRTILEGPAAVRALAKLLPELNHLGSGKKDVQAAVQHLEHGHGASRVILDAMESARFRKNGFPGHVASVPTPLRLALEMSLHEEDERAALEGELESLNQRWREAEEIAAIADSLTIPAGVDERLTALKRRSPLG